MKKLCAIVGLSVFGIGAAQAGELDTCTTFVDEPPGVNDQLLCDKEKQHVAEMGLPASDDQMVFTLNDLYELGWSLLSVQRFRNTNGDYSYRVYIVREN